MKYKIYLIPLSCHCAVECLESLSEIKGNFITNVLDIFNIDINNWICRFSDKCSPVFSFSALKTNSYSTCK